MKCKWSFSWIFWNEGFHSLPMRPCLDPALHRHLNRKVGYNFRVILAFKVPYWQAQFGFCGEYQPRENALLNENLSRLKLVSTEINGIFFHFKQTNKQTNSKTNKKNPSTFCINYAIITPAYCFSNINIFPLSKSLWRQKYPLTFLHLFTSYSFSYNLILWGKALIFCLSIDSIHEVKEDLEVCCYFPDSCSGILYGYLCEVFHLSKYKFLFNMLKMR